jgi:hypothetical protein
MSPGRERNQAVARARFSPFAAAALRAGVGPCVSSTPAAVRDAHGYPRVLAAGGPTGAIRLRI